MQVRLINPFLAEIHRLDTVSTEAYNPVGPSTSGYDRDFREPVWEDSDGDGVGTPVRKESPAIRVPCQVEVTRFEELQQAFSGDIPSSAVTLVMRFVDLNNLGLVDAISGEAMIRKNDRLGAIYTCAGELVQAFRNPPGMFVFESRPSSFGIGLSRNLLLVTFIDREHGVLRS